MFRDGGVEVSWAPTAVMTASCVGWAVGAVAANGQWSEIKNNGKEGKGYWLKEWSATGR